MVQDELKRRASLYSSKNPSRYSSKYALTGKVICAECGAKYRRVTWSRNGNKTIVWRCTERLKNGTKTCKNSPTIYEEDLHKAILDSLKEMLPKSDDIAKRVRNEIEAVLNKNDDNNPQVVRKRIQSLEKEAKILRNILRNTEDKEFYLEKIRFLEEGKAELEQKIATVQQYNRDDLIQQMHYIFENQGINLSHNFDAITKNIIKSVLINISQEVVILYF